MMRNPERYSFLFHAQGYLKAARLHCQQLLKPLHKWSDGNSRVPAEWPIPIQYSPLDLLPATLFNIHHGIELFLKCLLIDLGTPNDRSHDLRVLFAAIEPVILKTEWVPIHTTQEILSQNEIDRIKAIVIPELQELIAYIADRSILQQKLDDPANELFRYPRTKGGQGYDVSSLGNVDITDLLRKIDLLYEHLNDIGYLLAVDNRYQPRL